MQNTRKMNDKDDAKYAGILSGMESEIHSYARGYIQSLKNHDHDRFVEGAKLARKAVKDMGIELDKIIRFAEEGIKLA